MKFCPRTEDAFPARIPSGIYSLRRKQKNIPGILRDTGRYRDVLQYVILFPDPGELPAEISGFFLLSDAAAGSAGMTVPAFRLFCFQKEKAGLHTVPYVYIRKTFCRTVSGKIFLRSLRNSEQNESLPLFPVPVSDMLHSPDSAHLPHLFRSGSVRHTEV